MRLLYILLMLTVAVGCGSGSSGSSSSSDTDTGCSNATGYAIVDTGQTACYDGSGEIVNCPSEGEAFYGQDAQYNGHQPDYTNNGDGTVTDNVTGLMWQQSPDTDGVGDIDADDKLTYDQAVAGASTCSQGGYTDWRLPTIKELHSIVDYSRYPGTTAFAVIDPLYSATAITNEAGQSDYPSYWSGTTHANWTDTAGSAGAYVAFGRAMGYMDGA